MAPKKKKDTTKANKTEQQPVQEKSVPQPTKEDKKEEKVVQEPAKQTPKEQLKDVQGKDQGKGQKEPQKKPLPNQESEDGSKSKIKLDQDENLSEAEILRRRKLRFQMMGTNVSAEDADKLKTERLQKFGGKMPATQEEIEKRKLKFGLKGVFLSSEEKEALEKRKQKFGNVSGLEPEGKKTLDERKKKFGGNDISLDDEIAKNKHQSHKSDNKFRPRHGNSFDNNYAMKKFKR